MFALSLLLFDLFGLQVDRIPDVTQDCVDELVVTDPMGDREKERDGRILIVDPVDWSIVRELTAAAGETRIGGCVWVARRGRESHIAAVVGRTEPPRLGVALYSSPGFEREWTDFDLDEGNRLTRFGFDIACVAGAQGASVHALECSKPIELRPTHFRVLRRSRVGISTALEFDAQVPNRGGQILHPCFSRSGDLDGFFAAAIDGTRPFGRLAFPQQASRISWIDLRAGECCPITPEYGQGDAAGVSLVLGGPDRGRLSCEAVAVRRHQDGGELLFLSRTSVTSTLDFREPDPSGHSTYYWGTALCWVPDADGDGCLDLAVGCPEPFDGEVWIIGSIAGAIRRRVRPPPDGVDTSLPENWTYAPNFGTALCLIPDQDGDGQDDLAVSATTWGGCGAYPAGISLVSTKSWTVLRVIFERDLRSIEAR